MMPVVKMACKFMTARKSARSGHFHQQVRKIVTEKGRRREGKDIEFSLY